MAAASVPPPEEPTPAADPTLALAQQTLENLLARMKISASVATEWGPADEADGERTLLADVRGDDLSILLGRRGETLAALQYLARLLLAKQVSHGVNLIVDVEGFRQRRHEQLRRMARRTAEQVVQRGRAIALEPMPPDERRIVHLELRDHPQVRTESAGEGNRRKVTIYPK
jgi:spoIIIJ-associated protein